MSNHGFRDLRAWQHAKELVKAVYSLTNQFPENEKYGLTSQIRRAIVSVPANIAEGATRDSLKEFMHFISIARGSLAEVVTELEIAAEQRYISQQEYRKIMPAFAELARCLAALRKSLQSQSS